MLCRLILLGFGAVTLIEIALFIVIGQAFGVLSTLLAVLLMAMLGVAIIRRQGLSVLAQLRATMDTGKLPGRTIGDAMLVGLAGILMIIPGFFTDFVAILLLIPAVRTALFRFVGRRANVVDIRTTTVRPAEGPAVIELDDTQFRPR